MGKIVLHNSRKCCIFRQEKPAPGIAEVSVTNIDANSLRITVTGEALALPVELFDSNEGLKV